MVYSVQEVLWGGGGTRTRCVLPSAPGLHVIYSSAGRRSCLRGGLWERPEMLRASGLHASAHATRFSVHWRATCARELACVSEAC